MEGGNKGERFVQEQLATQRRNLLGVTKYGFIEARMEVLVVLVLYPIGVKFSRHTECV